MTRVQAAFFIQPFLCALLGFALFPLLDRMSGPGRTIDAFQTAIVIGVFTGIIGALITGLAARPLFRWVVSGRRLTALRTVLLAAALGNIPAAIAILLQVVFTGDVAGLPAIVIANGRAISFGTFIGVVSGIAFWLMAGRQVKLSLQDPL